MDLFKSILHNIGVVIIGLLLAYAASVADRALGVPAYASALLTITGMVLVAIGFLIRVWATYHFYKNQMKVIVLHAQGSLVTDGPFRYSRNPLYLGGNVFVFFGAAMLFASPTMAVLTLLHLPLVDRMVRREEKQLAERFGSEWSEYATRVRRWI